jgi:hypothetical protein
MKKQTFLFLYILIGGFLLHQILPWWSINVTALIAAYNVALKPVRSFMLAFLAAACLWGSSAWWQSAQGEHLLTEKMASLLGDTSVVILLTGTALLGGVLAGLGAATGSLGRAMLNPEKLNNEQ